MTQRPTLSKCAQVLTLLALVLPIIAQGATQAEKPDAKVLIKEVTGKDAVTLKDFLVDQGTASVSAAALAGIGTTPLTIVQDTKDFAVLLSPFDKEGKGGGFVFTPARARNPMPRIDLMTEYVASAWWRIASATNISGAQGKSEIGGKEYRRRAFAIATGGYFDETDDPIYQRAVAEVKQDKDGTLKGDKCYVAAFNSFEDLPTSSAAVDTGDDEAKKKEIEKQAKLTAFKDCVKKAYADSRNRWFAPRWSLAVGTGDAQASAGGQSVRTGDVIAIGATFGKPIGAAKGSANPEGATFLSGWAVTLVARHTRKEAVLDSLANGPVQRQNSTLVVGRLAAGTETWRLMFEASNNNVKKTAGGERTMKQAVGLDHRFGKDSWLNLRYGKRIKGTGGGEEAASLLTLTLGGDLLSF